MFTMNFMPMIFLFFFKELATGQTLLHGKTKDGLYYLPATISTKQALVREKASFEQRHRRLGHPSERIERSIIAKNKLPVVQQDKTNSIRFSCQLGKSHKFPFRLSTFISSPPLELVHSDLWGPAPVTSSHGHRFYIHFINDFSKFSWLHPLVQKSDACNAFLKSKLQVENHFDSKIKNLQTDGGTECFPFKANHGD